MSGGPIPYEEVVLAPAMVRVVTESGPHDAPALTVAGARGLAVTMANFGAFTVTHVPSGMKLCGQYERAARALLVLAQFAVIGRAYGIDWSLEAEAVRTAVERCGRRPVPFPGATHKDAAGTRTLTVAEWYRLIRGVVAGDEFPWEGPAEHPGEQAAKLLRTLPEQADP